VAAVQAGSLPFSFESEFEGDEALLHVGMMFLTAMRDVVHFRAVGHTCVGVVHAGVVMYVHGVKDTLYLVVFRLVLLLRVDIHVLRHLLANAHRLLRGHLGCLCFPHIYCEALN